VIVVSDTSPLTSLAQIGSLDLLERLFSRVLIPQAVADELRFGEAEGCHPHFLGAVSWIEVRPVKDKAAVDLLMGELGPGEAEAIVLAQEMGIDIVLIDEKSGRRIALERGLRPTGILGVLLSAKQAGLVAEVKPLLDDLRSRAGFWVGDDLYRGVLAQAQENPDA
jgi:predicted nucleic acid-binding protein